MKPVAALAVVIALFCAWPIAAWSDPPAVSVELLASTPERDVVSGPVAPGLPLILDGAYQVADGDAVRTSAAK